ncbi:MAG TPA: DoxX family protein, partial [Egibacteraceae bacterium]|nr:DoxX family protein [Egibacteraceae bacterium]
MDFDIAMLVLRVGIGTIFVAHGLQKLLGWWGGPGWDGFKGFIGSLGLKPPLFWASISLVAEQALRKSNSVAASLTGVPDTRVRWGRGRRSACGDVPPAEFEADLPVPAHARPARPPETQPAGSPRNPGGAEGIGRPKRMSPGGPRSDQPVGCLIGR